MAVNKVVNKSTKSHGAMRNVIEYVLQDQKVKEGYVAIIGPYAPEEINWDNVYNSFLQEKRLWNKDSGRMYAHNIISFHKDEAITPEQCLEIGQEFVDKFFPNHQSLIGVHQDKDHLHVHIVTNSVSFIDGMKLHQTKRDLERQKEFTNNLCLERGLSVTEKGKHFDGTEIEEGHVTAWSKDKYNLFQHDDKKSFVADCAIAFMEAREDCCSKEDFIKGMSERGWSVTWTDSKKHITFQNENGDKVRDCNLSKTFSLDISKEALLNEFERQNEIRLSRAKADRDKERADQLDKYYAEVESAIQRTGAVAETVRSTEVIDGRERLASGIRETSGSGKDTESLIRDIKSERRNQSASERQSAEKRNDSISERNDREIERERSRAERERQAKEAEQRARAESEARRARSRSQGWSR
jgi:hypothetical protein